MRIIDKMMVGVTLKSKTMARIGYIERFFLKRAGLTDARAGLPKEWDGRMWLTAFIQKEKSACNETISKKMLIVQHRLQNHYVLAMELAGRIKQIENQANLIAKRFPAEPTDIELNHRKNGEDDLTDEQIHRRRRCEYEKARLRIEKEVADVMKRADDDIRSLFIEESFISQMEHLAEIYVLRIKNHSRQRIDVYWSVLYANCEGREKIPAYYPQEQPSNLEVDFRKLHDNEHELIDKVLGKYKGDAA